MKINEKAVANSLAVVGGGYSMICSLLALFAPDLYKNIAISWAHGVDIAKVWRDNPPDFGTLVWGFITFTVAAWMTGYIFAYAYNYFVKGK